eukprot:366502-Chlamydomonas_euryale.AAC.10
MVKGWMVGYSWICEKTEGQACSEPLQQQQHSVYMHMAGHGTMWRSPARHNKARHGTAWLGSARHGMARHGTT